MKLDWELDDSELRAELTRIPADLNAEIVKALRREMINLVAVIRTAYLSGSPLHRKTGTLSRSIQYRILNGITEITAVAGTNLPYAPVHEYGLTVTQHVRAHMRATKFSTMMAKNAVKGRTNLKGFAKRERINQLKRKGNMGAAYVRAFDRTISYPKRAFFQPAFEFNRPYIIAAVQAAVQKALGGHS